MRQRRWGNKTGNMFSNRTALISGAGPSGIAAAIKLHQMGWAKIWLIEKENSLTTVNPRKAFNYQLDGRGQIMLADIGLGEDVIKQFGVANLETKFTAYGPDGNPKTLTIPFVLKDKQTAYWITRAALIDMMLSHLETINLDKRIELLTGHSFDNISNDDNQIIAKISNEAGEVQTLQADLILGCDGLNSKVRDALMNHPDLTSEKYSMIADPSPSSSLLYKVIKLPANIKVNGNHVEVTDNLRSYIFSSNYKAFNQKLSLFSLPVARKTEQRTANIILPDTHELWKIDSKHAFKAYLKTGFPQLDIDEVFPDGVMNGFLEYRPGKFPDPQYCPHIHARLGDAEAQTNFILIGDAAHSFPPDLGLGVNSALQDVFEFSQFLENSLDDIKAACKSYETARLPEAKALVRLVKTVFPYQYNHVPWRFNLSLVKMLSQMMLHRLSGGLIDEPAFRLSQNEKISFTELERRKVKTDRIFYCLLGFILIGLGLGIRLIF